MKEINKFAMDTRLPHPQGVRPMLRSVLDMEHIEVTVYDNGRVTLEPARDGTGPTYTFFGRDES
ncbi:MAG: hypothetical protein OXC29_22440 [Rhodococcus sp.]|nr:hypothetical protein [Rhodococcus sp. (in: high G+C Gram-positive bacteria)]